jgi:iron complex outermembrane receptor protein
MARLHYGFSDYHGTYAFEIPQVELNYDSARGQWYGLEASMVRPLGARHLVTAGIEFQDNFSQRQLNFFDVDPRVVFQDSLNDSRHLALFVQDEISLSKKVTLHVGVRQDAYEAFAGFEHQTSPRLGLIYDDGGATAVKLLHGRAFRAPNDFELHFQGPVYRTNPELGPETIHTTELVLERTLPRGVRLNASAYFNDVENLISLERDPVDDLLVFQNAGHNRSVGVEVGLEVKRRQGPSGRLSYAWQESREQPTGELLTNSPRHMAKAQITWPLLGKRLTASADGWYMSARRTLAGAEAGSAMVTNVTLAPRIRGSFDVSASVYNVFDHRYADPGSNELRQDLLPQDGRSLRLKLSWRF